jgi:hypothetical protein
VLLCTVACTDQGSGAFTRSSVGPPSVPTHASEARQAKSSSWQILARRPLHLPHVGPGRACPMTRQWQTIRARQWLRLYGSRAVLGTGPMYPLGPWPGAARLSVQIPSSNPARRGFAKVLWAWRAPLGDVLIRGGQVDGDSPVTFLNNAQRKVSSLRIAAKEGNGGLPTGTVVPHPGCYAWQIDGQHFSRVLVFQAVASGRYH